MRHIVTTRQLDWHRKLSSREEPSDGFDDMARPVTGGPPGSPDHAGGVVDRDEVMRALSVLSEPQRAVVVLRYYEGYDDTAIAAVLGAPRRRSVPTPTGAWPGCGPP